MAACTATRHLPGSNPSSDAAQQGREHEASACGLRPAADLGRAEKRHPRSHRTCHVRAHAGRVAARSAGRVPTRQAVSVNARVLAWAADVCPRQLAERTRSLRRRTLCKATERARRPRAHPARRMRQVSRRAALESTRRHGRERPTFSDRFPRSDLHFRHQQREVPREPQARANLRQRSARVSTTLSQKIAPQQRC